MFFAKTTNSTFYATRVETASFNSVQLQPDVSPTLAFPT